MLDFSIPLAFITIFNASILVTTSIGLKVALAAKYHFAKPASAYLQAQLSEVKSENFHSQTSETVSSESFIVILAISALVIESPNL